MKRLAKSIDLDARLIESGAFMPDPRVPDGTITNILLLAILRELQIQNHGASRV